MGVKQRSVATLHRAITDNTATSASRCKLPVTRTKVVRTQDETRPVSLDKRAPFQRAKSFVQCSFFSAVISAKLHPQSELINDVGEVSASHHSSIPPPHRSNATLSHRKYNQQVPVMEVCSLPTQNIIDLT
jgi:hypothetical protein